jgi:RNA polymerase sigma-70 factor (ECF subfamily)
MSTSLLDVHERPPSAGRSCTHDDRSPSAPEFELAVSGALERMYELARSILKSDDLAWDAVQETLIGVWKRGGLPADSTKALRRLTYLSCLHALRSQRSRLYHEDRVSRGARSERDPPAPFAALEREERARALREELARMPVCYRCVLELFELEGHDYATIAGRLGIPVGTVRSRLSRARRELRGRLAGRLDPALQQ